MRDQKGWCVWVTGLPGSGKSTITSLLEKKLRALGAYVGVVSVDLVRKHLTPTPTYSEEERSLVYGALVFTSLMLTKHGVNVIIDATGNRRRFREQARHLIADFMEAYVKCPLDVCMQREKTVKICISLQAKSTRRRNWGTLPMFQESAFPMKLLIQK